MTKQLRPCLDKSVTGDCGVIGTFRSAHPICNIVDLLHPMLWQVLSPFYRERQGYLLWIFCSGKREKEHLTHCVWSDIVFTDKPKGPLDVEGGSLMGRLTFTLPIFTVVGIFCSSFLMLICFDEWVFSSSVLLEVIRGLLGSSLTIPDWDLWCPSLVSPASCMGELPLLWRVPSLLPE